MMKATRRVVAVMCGVVFVGGAVACLITGCEWRYRSENSVDARYQLAPPASDGSVAFTTVASGDALAGADGGVAQLPTDELWVIAKAEGSHYVAPRRDDEPGSGALVGLMPGDGGEMERVPIPLKHTEVRASVAAYIATVDVRQQFENPYDEKIEAVYVFPLPQNAAVSEFVMTIGDRRIRGIIRERAEAERIYEEARRQGFVASLLTQERPNIFTQKVANIEPGKRIDVNVRYFNTLAYREGWYEFVFPMVVGPRFNPPGLVDGIGAVGRGEAGQSGQGTEVSYLRPDERSGHDIDLQVEIVGGVSIEEITSDTHNLHLIDPDGVRVKIGLQEADRIPNRDFVLRYRLAGDSIKTNLITHRDERGGYFTLVIYPPAELKSLSRRPMEMIYVLDCSGSMSGEPIAQAKRAIHQGLARLGRDDTFQVIQFSNDASQLGAAPIAATRDNVRRGERYVNDLNSGGGTMMIEGIKAALDFDHDEGRYRYVCFMTDGYIGNERDILGAVRERLGASRIFSFGVGSSVNRYLMEGMARVGRGTVAYVGLNEEVEPIMESFYERITHPALTDIEIDWGGMGVTDVYPRRVPDLFVGRPVILAGRFEGEGPRHIRISGVTSDERLNIGLEVSLDEAHAAHVGLAQVWARAKIADMATAAIWDENPDLADEIKQVALDYGLMSAYTAFVAVDATRRTEGDHGTTVKVPVPVPDGVKYETTVVE